MKSRKNSSSKEKNQINNSNSSTAYKKSVEESFSRDDEYG